MRGKFPQTCKPYNSPKHDIKSSLGYFHMIGILPMSLNCILKYPQGFYRERSRKYPHRKFSFISPEFPQGNNEEICTGMIPWKSPINPRGNQGDVDGLPAGAFQ